MVVCVCRAVSDGELRRAARDGAPLEAVARSTGAGSDCGRCAPSVARIVAEAGRGCHSGAGACPDCPSRGTHVPAPDRAAQAA